MLSGLAVNWVFLLLRAIIAALFGVAVLVWPTPPTTALVVLFAAYAAADGLLALMLALSVKGVPGFGSLLFEALVRLGVATFALASPARTSLALHGVFAAWAVLSGIAALAVAVALADTFKATLHVLHVLQAIVSPAELPLHFESRQLEEAVEATAWDQLRRLFDGDERAPRRATLAIEWGLPAPEIIRYAQEHEIDLISMGTHGGGRKRLLLGSVAESVVRGAPCPVLTSHHSERELTTMAHRAHATQHRRGA
jgi:nucleotide-binding universal stress UspA family protein